MRSMSRTAIFVPAFLMFFSLRSFAAPAVAPIRPTAEGSTVSGKATLEDTTEGVKMTVELSGVTPGKHGFHVHENGSCADAGKAAGGHYNPEGAPHGLIFKDGAGHAHPGDLGNLLIGESGGGKFETVVAGLSVQPGPHSVIGRSLILHEKEDDLTSQPSGNAGDRIACGVIEAAPTVS